MSRLWLDENQLKSVLFDLEVHWTSPCSNCAHVGSPRTHAARVEAIERLIVGGWLDPARRWPFDVPQFLRPLIGEANRTSADGPSARSA